LRFALATNAAATDADRVRHVVPHWLRVFGDRVAELVVVLDRRPPSGRIAELHGDVPPLDQVKRALDDLASLDARIRVVPWPPQDRGVEVARRWFRSGHPERCQAGTPILPFAAAIDAPGCSLVLRCDCDMLFHERGWLTAAAERLGAGTVDLVEPPRLGETPRAPEISTRSLVLERAAFRRAWLPMPAHRLDLFRRVHRRLHGRPTWIALEQMLERERARRGLRFELLDPSLGFSLHVARRQDAARPGFADVVAAIERGEVPDAQRRAGANFEPTAWPQLDRPRP
jgi:hypothetical protein